MHNLSVPVVVFYSLWADDPREFQGCGDSQDRILDSLWFKCLGKYEIGKLPPELAAKFDD